MRFYGVYDYLNKSTSCIDVGIKKWNKGGGREEAKVDIKWVRNMFDGIVISPT